MAGRNSDPWAPSAEAVTLALSNNRGENDLTHARVWIVRALVALAFAAFGAWTLAALLYGFVSLKLLPFLSRLRHSGVIAV